MARSDVNTFGLLNRWPLIVHEDIWTFNQLVGNGVRQFANRQNTPYIQFERDYIADALFQAAMAVTPYLGFFPIPTWVEGEMVTVNADLAWNRQTLEVRYGHLSAFGRRAVSEIDTGAVVTYSDEDGDGVEETAAVTVTTAAALDEIQVFVQPSDGAPSTAHEQWRIEPLTAKANGDGTVTLRGHKALFVHPDTVWSKEYTGDGVKPKYAGDTQAVGDFLTAVDVYRVYADTTGAVQLILNPDLVGEGNTPVNAMADITNARQGRFTLRTDDGQTAPVMQPLTVRVWYKAGLPLVDGRMDRRLETAIVRLANTYMPQQPAMLDRTLAMWDADRKPAETLTPYDAQHPPAFGVTSAGVYAAAVVDAMQNRLKGLPVYAR